MLVTVLVGMLLTPSAHWTWQLFSATLLGVALSAGSAAAINHLLDSQIDVKMRRTENRPVAKGRVKPYQVLIFSLALSSIGLSILCFEVNGLTALLTFLSLIGYAGIYTGFLKRATTQNIVIGGLAGAAPPLLGNQSCRRARFIIGADYFCLDATSFLGFSFAPNRGL
jgi:protoheme IX farnesyltransferase